MRFRHGRDTLVRSHRQLRFLIVLLGPVAAWGQDDTIHWAYASYFGFGRYSLDGQVDTTVISATPGRVQRRPESNDDGTRRMGIRIRVPISIGAHELSSLDGIGDISLRSVNAISVVPGVEVELPMTQRWSLKSLAYAGFGTETRGGDDARIFHIGIRSRLRFERPKGLLYFVSGLERFGYSASGGASDAISAVIAGFEVERPLANKRLGGEPLAIHWHIHYSDYVESLGLSLSTLDLSALDIQPSSIDREWEVGTAFSRRGSRLSFGKLAVDRVGLAYRFDGDGQFSGIGVTFSSLFDR